MMLTRTQINHYKRNLIQRIFLPEIAIIGGYHGGNIGDMALGKSVSDVLNEKGISNGLQTIYNLEGWPKAKFAIIGGGAVGYTDSLIRVYNRYKTDFSKLGFLGVDFNEKTYPDKIKRMLRESAFVSCRSEEQANRLKFIVVRNEVFHHPDIAFSLVPKFSNRSKNPIIQKQKKMFVNLVPLYGKFKNGKIIPDFNYKSERVELYENFDLMHKNYKVAVRECVEKALADGFKVETAPFTPQDREYSKIILKDLDVKNAQYHSDPIRMLNHISTCEKFICTRFHATIFGLKAGVKVHPIAYAKKNELMLTELGIRKNDYISTTDLASGINNLPEGLVFDKNIIKKWEIDSKSMVQLCVDSLLANK